MTRELSYLGWTIALGIVQLVAAGLAKRMQEPSGWAAGPRDEPPPPYEGIAGRLQRAQANLMETLPFFSAAVLICHVAGRDGSLSGWGAAAYFWCRLAYVPLYAFGVPYVRTLVWLGSAVGLCLVVSACLSAL